MYTNRQEEMQAHDRPGVAALQLKLIVTQN